MKLPKTIELANLIETIVEIRLVPNSNLDRDLWAGILVSRLDKVGFRYHKVPQWNVVSEGDTAIKVSIEKDKVNSTINLFVNDEDGVLLLISGSTMSFNCKKGKYIGWDKYFDKIVEILKIVESEHIIQSYERTMIRYISEYNFNILEKVDVAVDSHSDNRYNTLEICLTRQEERTNAYITISGLRERLSKPTKEKRVTSLFDVNVFERLTENANFEDVCNSLHNIHRIEKESYFGLLKEDYVKSLNPVY